MEMLRRSSRFMRHVSIYSLLFLALSVTAAAQSRFDDCDEPTIVDAKLHFKQLRARFLKDSSAVDQSELRRAAADYIRQATECYESQSGESASGPMIDEGGLWMSPEGPTTHPVSPDPLKYVLFGTKWGAGSPFFPTGTDVPGPEIPGGTVTYSYMANGVDLTAEAPGLFNTAITSLATFAPCFLDEIELALGAWSAVADILFVPVTDGGGPFNVDPVADIRIGAHVFDGPSGTLAHAYFPPPNGFTAAGDTHFDLAETWTCAPAAGSFGFGVVSVHEFGHAIGLSHEVTDLAVMNPSYNAALIFGPLADDVIGAGEIYGEAGGAETSFFGPVGIGTDAPAALLHVQGDAPGFPALFMLENTGSDFAGFRFTTTTGSIDFNKAGGNTFRLNVVDGDSWELQLDPAGDLTIRGSIFTAGSCSVGCDRVFAPDYELPTIEEHAEAMWRDRHLPAVGPTEEGQPMNLSDKTERILNELEKAHIYIEQLHVRLEELEAGLVKIQSGED